MCSPNNHTLGQLVTDVSAETLVRILKSAWEFDRSRHGCLYDRGGADFYYGRAPLPHYGGVGGGSGETVLVTDADSAQEYMAGYLLQQASGVRK
jgi:hypothetical protein